MALNGILAGLVGITAGADTVGMGSSILIGAVAGSIVVFSIVFFDRIKIDDPVGAISVHGICGVWGTLAVGIFSTNAAHSFFTQLLGTAAISAWAFVFSLVVFGIIKATIGVRVSEEDEVIGLDVTSTANQPTGRPRFHRLPLYTSRKGICLYPQGSRLISAPLLVLYMAFGPAPG